MHFWYILYPILINEMFWGMVGVIFCGDYIRSILTQKFETFYMEWVFWFLSLTCIISGEENDEEFAFVWCSTSTLYGHDGPSGEIYTFSTAWLLHWLNYFLIDVVNFFFINWLPFIINLKLFLQNMLFFSASYLQVVLNYYASVML